MGKVSFRSKEIESAAFVEEARKWAKALVRAESRFPGDYGLAMRRVAARVGVPFKFLWRLHYEPPKTMDVGKYSRIKGEFYRDQELRYRRWRAETTATTALGRALLRAADSLASQETGAVIDD